MLSYYELVILIVNYHSCKISGESSLEMQTAINTFDLTFMTKQVI